MPEAKNPYKPGTALYRRWEREIRPKKRTEPSKPASPKQEKRRSFMDIIKNRDADIDKAIDDAVSKMRQRQSTDASNA